MSNSFGHQPTVCRGPSRAPALDPTDGNYLYREDVDALSGGADGLSLDFKHIENCCYGKFMHKVDCKDHHYPHKSQRDLSDVSSLRSSSLVTVNHFSCHGPLKPSSPHWGGQKILCLFP